MSFAHQRRPGEGRDPLTSCAMNLEIPAFAGMTESFR